MLTDQQGNNLSGATAEAAALYDQAVAAFNIYRGDPVGLLDQATAAAPRFAMGHIAKAHLFVTTSEPGAIAQARDLVETARALKLNDREKLHIAALDRLFDGEWTQAALAFDRLNIEHPRDLLALQVGQLMDFFGANARNLRDRPARALPSWSPDIPGYSILHGMYAFGLEECGDYARAEDEGRLAIALQPLDCWAHHAVTHVMEMQGRPEDGIGWMIAREPYWSGDDNLFKVHNWWHRALFHIEIGQLDDALALYDGPVRENHSGIVLELVDASALLWRLQLSGTDIGDRWQELATAWQPHVDGHTYPFNDWHAVMAFLGAGREQDVERVVSALQKAAASGSEASRWAHDVGLPLVEGFVAYARGDYRAAIDSLFDARCIANAFGGSHAQRDVIDWTLQKAATLSGSKRLLEALANERVARKPHSPLTRKWVADCVAEPPAETRVA